MILHVRGHHMGRKPEVRVWTDEMAGYGQFEVKPWAEVSQFLKLGRHLGIVSGVVVHCCDTDDDCGYNDDARSDDHTSPCMCHEELPEEL